MENPTARKRPTIADLCAMKGRQQLTMLRFVRQACDTGHSCIFIADNIHHLFQVVDRMVAMRHGAIVADNLGTKTSSIQDFENIITGEHLAA